MKVYTILLNVIANVWFTFFHLSFVVLSVQVPQLIVLVKQLKKLPKECSSFGGTRNQNYFYQHFLSDSLNGLRNDCDKTDPSDPTKK